MELMTPYFVKIVYAVAFGITFVNISGIPNAVKKWLCDKRIWYTMRKVEPKTTQPVWNVYEYLPRRIKPFDCESCMAFWCALALFIFPQILTYEFTHAFFSGCICACLACWGNKKLRP